MQLGVGVRVWIGWVPEDQIEDTAVFDGRCKKGTIDDGPFTPGTTVRDAITGEIQIIDGLEIRWNVALDEGGRISAAESILFPIDDSDETERTVHEKGCVHRVR